jgi:hypothetical protein
MPSRALLARRRGEHFVFVQVGRGLCGRHRYRARVDGEEVHGLLCNTVPRA